MKTALLSRTLLFESYFLYIFFLEYVKSLADKYGLPLTLHNNHTKGYHIVMTIPGNRKRTFKKSELPEEFVQVDIYKIRTSTNDC